VGTGPAAELAAATDDLRRLQQRDAASERRQEETRYLEAATPLLELCHGTDILARAALVAAGFHRHDRGEWRRDRGAKSTKRINPTT
jgi:hypothetical protein